MSEEKKAQIYQSLATVMQNIGAIGKSSKNVKQNFMFRGIDQVYNAVHPLMAKEKIFSIPRVLETDRETRRTASGGILTLTILKMEFEFMSGEDGSSITIGPVIGEGMDPGDKSANKAMSIAHKYAVFMLFMVPTEVTDDPDYDTPEETVFEDIVPTTIPKKVAPPDVTDTSVPSPDDTSSEIHFDPDDSENAAGITDLLIQLTGMHSGSMKSLVDFWKKNAKVIAVLDENFPEEYERLRAKFTEIRHQLEGDNDD